MGARFCAGCGARLFIVVEAPSLAELDRELDLGQRNGPPPGKEHRVLDCCLDLTEPPCLPEFGGDPDLPELAGGATSGASLLRRAVAWGADAGVLSLVAAPPLLFAVRAADAAGALLPCGAFVGLLAFTYGALSHGIMGATFGERFLGLQVTDPSGGPPGLSRSAARAAMAVLGTAAFGLGPLAALFTRSRRGLHDLVARTIVVRAP
ncbi:MAG TPA: RDD family protein [Anaeromyxobacteraceae bacterium]|nr:RDD family protein [Anaeromyxobacteraceae bacterium]